MGRGAGGEGLACYSMHYEYPGLIRVFLFAPSFPALLPQGGEGCQIHLSCATIRHFPGDQKPGQCASPVLNLYAEHLNWQG